MNPHPDFGPYAPASKGRSVGNDRRFLMSEVRRRKRGGVAGGLILIVVLIGLGVSGVVRAMSSGSAE